MSRLPHEEGVAEVVALLDQVAALEVEAMELRPKAERLQAVEADLQRARQRLPELLSSMDVESPGNCGWERRMGWFLAEMHRQLLAPRPADCDGCAKVARHPGEGYRCLRHPGDS